jgi:predicted metalloprotease
MKWDDYRQSDNLEDRRSGGGFGGGMPGGRGGLGIGTMLVLGIVGYALGIDPRILIGGAEMLQGARAPTERAAAPGPASRPSDDMGRFVSVVLAQNEDVWEKVLPRDTGKAYEAPRLVLFRGVDRSGCGTAQAAMGPFYCPADRRVYLDTSFFEEMKRKLGGGGDFAYAYVVAHEVGHHIQNLLGILPRVEQLKRRASEVEANSLSVRVELQADCFAGVYAFHVNQMGRLERGDIEEAMSTASAIGDDKLQRAAQGYVVPDSFTHGSAEQRMRWFMSGFRSGTLKTCDTFSTQRL